MSDRDDLRDLLGEDVPEAELDHLRRAHDALRATLLEYRQHMHTNEPVHTWE